MERRSDAELLRAARGDPEAFRVIYQRHARAVYHYALAHAPTGEVAADLTAEVFAQAWRGRRRFKDQAGGSALPWLLGIARRLALAYHRKERLEQRALMRLGLEPSLHVASPDERVARVAGLAQLRHAIEPGLVYLTVEQRQVIQLRVLDGLPYSEVAARLGCEPAAARMRTSRALRALRAHLTEAAS